MSSLLENLNENFAKIESNKEAVEIAIDNLMLWLTHPDFEEYQPQLNYLIEQGNYEELYDSFFQVIPFGTGGRRGLVGIGTNRINAWTIAASAQGHSQYLLKKGWLNAQKRGIVIAYDVRQFLDDSVYSKNLPNPVWGISSCDLAEVAASVYARNGIKVHFFDEIRSTPQLSFTIRYLNAAAGINISASHNPPNYNGKKVYDENGGQLIPPDDQELADEVNKNVKIEDVKWGIFDNYVKDKSVYFIHEEVEAKFVSTVMKISRSKDRNIRVLYSPLHGTGKTSIYKVMKYLDFDIHLDPESQIPSGEFETVPNQIANPELPIVFERLHMYADEIGAKIIITSDPDADRMGISVKGNKKNWTFLDGNETAVLIAHYLLKKAKARGGDLSSQVIFATIPVTKLLEKICDDFGVNIENELLPGFKYLANRMNDLNAKRKIENFLFATEDTLGHLAGDYARDKDGCTGCVLLSEYSAELNSDGSDLLDELERIYSEYGYFINKTVEIKFEHSFEKSKIEKMMSDLRSAKEKFFEEMECVSFTDYWEGEEIISETDRSSRNLLEYIFKPQSADSCRICIRPSGTEPKLKIYIEVSVEKIDNFEVAKALAQSELGDVLDIITARIKKLEGRK